MIPITIFTPTFNRKETLLTLYHSLTQQTYNNFEWIIVDDGSTDNTESLIQTLHPHAPFIIKYIKKNNEGKHIAINEGVKYASGKWFFIVDSDDVLMPNAIQTVLQVCSQIENNKNYAGVAGLRSNSNGEIYDSWFGQKTHHHLPTQSYIDGTYIDYRYKLNFKGDRAEIVRTDILKQYSFPKFGDETFLVESYLWLSLAKDNYLFRWFNTIIYVTEYRTDGLTHHIAEHYHNNPIGSYQINNLRLSCHGIGITEYLRSCYRYYKYGFLAGKNTRYLFKNCNKKIFSIISLPLALLKK